MLKTLGRILIILLVTAIIATAIYFIAQSTMDSTEVGAGAEGQITSGQFQGRGTGLHNGTGPGNGGGEFEESSLAGDAWLGLVKDIAIIALATIVVALVKRIFSKKVENVEPEIE